MNMNKGIVAAMLAGLMFTGLSACEKDGPGEKAGKAIDDAASDVADEANDTMEAIKEKVEE